MHTIRTEQHGGVRTERPCTATGDAWDGWHPHRILKEQPWREGSAVFPMAGRPRRAACV